MQYDFGLSKIYELVINSNPCYAFLLDGNSLIQNKLIVAHVLAHCDFFKNNYRFPPPTATWSRACRPLRADQRRIRTRARHRSRGALHRCRWPSRSMSTRS
ncbi:SpoVR family protein [Paenibacillus sp. FSL R5-0378]|uniref:SpoVR family protein n=1 Tax=Paenibacillus sp. FSL R5-0378 TaxID=2921637 RepID=UPI0040469545